MRKALIVAALLFAIGLLLSYIGLSVHGIVAEAAQAQIQPPKIVQPTPQPFQFGPPTPPNIFIPDPPPPPWPVVPVKPKKPAQKFAPIPQDNSSCVSETDPCRRRLVNVI